MPEPNAADKFHLQETDAFDYDFNDDEKKMLDERRQNRLNGTSQTYLWEDAKAIITGERQNPIIPKSYKS